MSVKDRLKVFVKDVGMSNAEFEKAINASNGYINSISKSIGVDKIQLMIEKFPNLNIDWLLTGRGNQNLDANKPSEPTYNSKKSKTLIPRVGVNAIAGDGNAAFGFTDSDIIDYYNIPEFKEKGADFIIGISGNSMEGKFNKGDLVGCKILHDNSLIEWREPHVIATRDMGILVKRIYRSDSEDHLKLVSENQEYQPIEIPKKEVEAIAVIVGSIQF